VIAHAHSLLLVHPPIQWVIRKKWAKRGSRSFIGLFVRFLSRKNLRNSKTDLSGICSSLIIVLFYVVASWVRPRMASVVRIKPPPSTTTSSLSRHLHRSQAQLHIVTIRSLLGHRHCHRSLRTPELPNPPAPRHSAIQSSVSRTVLW